MKLSNGIIVECTEDKITLIKHKGSKSESRMTILYDDTFKLQAGVLKEKCKAMNLPFPSDQFFTSPIEPTGVLK